MKFELEPDDIYRAFAAYLQLRNVYVDADPANFVLKAVIDGKETPIEDISVLVRNSEMRVAAAPAAPVPVGTTVVNAAIASAPAAAPPRRVLKNDPFTPVAPPQRYAPPPRQKLLDAEAAASHVSAGMTTTALGVIQPSEVVHTYRPEYPTGQKNGAVAVQDSTSDIVTDPSSLDPENLAIFNELLERSKQRAETIPLVGIGPGGVDDLGQAEFVDE